MYIEKRVTMRVVKSITYILVIQKQYIATLLLLRTFIRICHFFVYFWKMHPRHYVI